MNLAVCVRVKCPLVTSTLVKIGDMHRNHCCFLFLNVEKLDQTLFQSIVEVHTLCLLKAMYMSLSEENFVVLNDKDWPLHSASIRVEPDLLISDVTHNRDLLGDLIGASEVLDTLQQVVRVVVRAEPVAIHKDLDVFTGSDHRFIPLLELLDAKVLQDGDEAADRPTNRNKCHQGKVLDEAAGCPFRCLSRADHAPVCVMELTWLGEFA